MKNVRSTFRVLFLLRESRIKKDGLSSLMIRITINKDKFELSSQLSIDPRTWDAKAGKISGRSNYTFETNAHIEFIRSRLHKLYPKMSIRIIPLFSVVISSIFLMASIRKLFL